MTAIDIPRIELGRTEAFLSYNSLAEINSIDSNRQFKYAGRDTYTPSPEFHNRALMFGIGESVAKAISEELRDQGYIGLVELKTTSSRMGINQITGRPVVPA